MVAFTSCNWEVKDNRAADLDIKVARYDRLQFEYVTMNSVSALQKMKTDFPQATKILIEDVLSIGEVNDVAINERLLEYYSDTTLLALMKDVEGKFFDLSEVEKKLTQGFKRLKKEVPALPVPLFYSQISALNQSVVVNDSIIGFSLDKYMGADYPIYKRFFHDYQCRSMEPDRIVPDCFTFYLLSKYPLDWRPKRALLDMIMHHGKINWVEARVLGYESYEKEMGYSEEEETWCKKNKAALWQMMVQNGHLYATDPMIVRTYLRPEPYTSILGDKTPAGVGVWMGILIIDEYMKKHPEVTVNDLLTRSDYSQMLEDTDFNP